MAGWPFQRVTAPYLRNPDGLTWVVICSVAPYVRCFTSEQVKQRDQYVTARGDAWVETQAVSVVRTAGRTLILTSDGFAPARYKTACWLCSRRVTYGDPIGNVMYEALPAPRSKPAGGWAHERCVKLEWARTGRGAP